MPTRAAKRTQWQQVRFPKVMLAMFPPPTPALLLLWQLLAVLLLALTQRQGHQLLPSLASICTTLA
jgi:hypothetical protein